MSATCGNASRGPASMSTGQSLELAARLTRALPQDLAASIAQAWNEDTSGELARTLRSMLFVGPNGFPSYTGGMGRGVFRIRVDCTRPIVELRDQGEYDSVEPKPIEQWLFHKSGPLFDPPCVIVEEVVLVRLGVCTDVPQVRAAMCTLGLRPANAWETLAFGAQWPHEQRTKHIYGVGQTTDDGRVIGLSSPQSQRRADSKRSVYLYPTQAGFPHDCYYLGAPPPGTRPRLFQ